MKLHSTTAEKRAWENREARGSMNKREACYFSGRMFKVSRNQHIDFRNGKPFKSGGHGKAHLLAA